MKWKMITAKKIAMKRKRKKRGKGQRQKRNRVQDYNLIIQIKKGNA